MIVKKIEEVVSFQEKLLKNRNQRLTRELISNREKLKEVENEIEKKCKELNKLLKYLDTHGALDEYTSLNKKLSDLKIKLEKLKEYQEILKTYKKKLRDVQSELSEQNIQTEEYLESNQDLLEEIMNTFRNLSKSFYDKPGGIKIENNDGDNTLRYNIIAKIQDDSSDGVNEVKIFCYDMTMLLLQQNHKFEFLFHDSRLFANMDPRQRYTLFKQAFEKVNENGLQYIASINEDTLDSFKDLMELDEYKKIIDDNIILKLTDESDASKLLGVQIDMDYEK